MRLRSSEKLPLVAARSLIELPGSTYWDLQLSGEVVEEKLLNI